MDFLRKHWFDVGAGVGLVVSLWVYKELDHLTTYQLIMWVSLLSLFAHQVEEYRLVGTFPGMVNKVMYQSAMPDRYPLNTNTSLYVNALVGWVSYFLAAWLAERAIWLGIATILVSLGNTVAHAFVFNVKGRTFYNAGMATSWLLFGPISYYFFMLISQHHLVTCTDYLIGVPAGILLNVVGIVKLIDWLKDPNTNYIFPQRCLLPEDRKPL
ncbi:MULTISPECIES: HXXEE domain-containing protein [Spirosoma]|nr:MULTISPECIES: HXXEE domain-containing protein [Spirosoma]UHG94610.1 HXXEE domain-containing protein [Spirosoma oryzicola]